MTNRRNVVTLAALTAVLATAARAQSPGDPGAHVVRTVHDLEGLRPGGADSLAIVAGYHSPGDGGGGLFVWSPESQEHADDGLVFGARTGQAGRWRRLVDGAINVRMFGAKGDGKNDDSAAIQAAIDAAAGDEVRIPAGRWLIRRTLRFRSPPGRSSAGLKLIGEGPAVTIIDSRVVEGPAILIAQAEAYRFGTHGMLRGFDLFGGHAPLGKGYDQHGISMSGAWQYRMDRVVVTGFRGHGLMVPFVTDRGGRFTEVDLVAGSNIAYRSKGRFLDTVNNNEVIEGEGVAPNTVVKGAVDEKRLIMSQAALRSGRVTLNIWGGNADGQTSIVRIQDCRFTSNTGWGIYNDAGIGLILSLRETQIGNNSGGGLRSGGAVDMHGGTCTDNGTDDGKGCGILIEGRGKSPVDHVRIESVEIDGNREYNLWLRRARMARVTRCRFNAVERTNIGRQLPLAAIRLGDSDGSSADTVEFTQNMIRVGGIHHWSHVGFDIPDGAAVENVVARDTLFWGGWSDEFHTRYRVGRIVNPAARIVFEEGGLPAPGQPAPPAYVVQLRSDSKASNLLEREAMVLLLNGVVSSPGRLLRAWPVRRISGLETTAGSADAQLGGSPAEAPAKGAPLLLLDGQSTRLTRVAGSDGTTVHLNQAEARSWKGAGYAGGIDVPFEAHYAVEIAADVTGSGGLQSVSLMLLVSGKEEHAERTALLGLPGPQTLRLMCTARCAAGATLHVMLRNESAMPATLQQARMTVRLVR